MKFAITPSESVAQLVARTQYAPQSQSTSAPVHSQSPEDSTASPSPSSDTKDLSLNIDPSLITPKSPTSRSSSNKHATSQIFSFGAPVVPFTRPRRDTTPAVSAMTSSLLPVLNPTRPSPSRSSTPSGTAAVPYPTPNTVTNSSSVPNPRPNDTRLPPLIPKAVTDKLQSQQSRIDELEMTLQRQQDLVESLHGEDDAKSAPKSKVKGTHDNVLNTAVRKTFMVAMGLPKTTKIKDAAAVPRVKAGGCYIVDSETGSKLLRPDWDASFNENSRWHQRMLVYTRQQAPLHSPALSAATMAAESDDCILEQLGAVFKNIAGEARKLGEEADDESEAVDSAQISRRKRRKKCDERMAAVAKSGKKLPTSWKFFTQPVYHSTDESDAAVVIDPDTETEAVWRSNAPGVRFDNRGGNPRNPSGIRKKEW
ncbi:hypothetical protein B0H14DRAFT_2618821 [Mycena olivaceomarginata]|nr:hypothetical protein B0H14DRAFT_2618821 [Mycena olivaceomarginata]